MGSTDGRDENEMYLIPAEQAFFLLVLFFYMHAEHKF